MLLTIDIGNTNIVAGLFQKNKLLNRIKIVSNTDMDVNSYSKKIKGILSGSGKYLDIAIISSVVPSLTPIIKNTKANRGN